MNTRFQARIQRYGWDKAVPYYEAGWKDSLAPAQKKLLELADPKPGETVADLACGTGLVTFCLASAVGNAGHVVATDISDRMVEAVHEQAGRRGAKNIVAFRADAEALDPINDDTFDLATCALGLMYCSEPTRAMREVFRILKPGGRAVFAVWGARKNCGWAGVFPIVGARVKSAVCPMFFRLGTGSTLLDEMTGAGFADVHDVRLTTHLRYEDEDAAVDAAFVGGPVALAYARFDTETRKAVRAEYVASISQFKQNHGYAIPGEFVVCRGFKPCEAPRLNLVKTGSV